MADDDFANYPLPENRVSYSSISCLEWDQKKQDMIINLGLTTNSNNNNNNLSTDQTPTPTRFIRNCEEVGLFQDLQNVNPFDEQFKKAVEDPDRSVLPASTTNDTLLTPQIYPQLVENLNYNEPAPLPVNYPFDNVISTNIESPEDGDNALVIALESEAENQATCLNKRGHSEKIEANKVEIVREPSKRTNRRLTDVRASKMRQREVNKAAQSRCRERRKIEYQNLKVANASLLKENARLVNDNAKLEKTVKRLQRELKEARQCNSTSMDETETDSRTSTPEIPTGQNVSKLPMLVPRPPRAVFPIFNCGPLGGPQIIVMYPQAVVPGPSDKQ